MVILSFEEYARLQALEAQSAPSFVDHLVAMPADDEPSERPDLELRDAAL